MSLHASASSLAVPTLIDGGTSISLGAGAGTIHPSPSHFPLPLAALSMCHGIAICIIARQLADKRDRADDYKKKKEIMPSMINMTLPQRRCVTEILFHDIIQYVN